MRLQKASKAILQWIMLAGLGLLVTAGCGASAGGAGPSSSTPTATAVSQLYTHTQRSCSWGSGRPATCQYHITNQPQSNITFAWVGTSTPAGASFSPPSGSIAPGETTGVISVTDPFICPITFQFVDTTHGVKVEFVFKDPCA